MRLRTLIIILLLRPTGARAEGFSLLLRGFVQADGVAYREDAQDQLGATGQPLNGARFVIPRARLRAELSHRYFSSALEFDGNTVNGPSARIQGAEVSARWPSADPKLPYVMATIGLFKVPFGFEVLESDAERLFLERSAVIRALFPGEYDLGVRLQGGWRWLRYALAVMNGEPMGSRPFPLLDPNHGKDVMGRLGAAGGLSSRVRLSGGVSGLYGSGFAAGHAATVATLTWRDDNQDGVVQLSELQGVPGSPATASQNFERFALGGDVQLGVEVPRLGPLRVYGEVVWAHNLDRSAQPSNPVASGRDLTQLGGYVAFSQQLFGYGLVGVRYDHYDADWNAGAQAAPRHASLVALTAGAQYPPLGRVLFQYDLTSNAHDAFTCRVQAVF